MTASALTALASIAIGVMAVKKGNAKAMAQGIKEGLEKGQKLGIKEGSETGFKKGFDQAEKEMEKYLVAYGEQRYEYGMRDGLKLASGKAFDRERIALDDFKSYGGKFVKGKATINGQPFRGVIVTPKAKLEYAYDGYLYEAVLKDGTVKKYCDEEGFHSVIKGSKWIDYNKNGESFVKTVYRGGLPRIRTTFENGIPVSKTYLSNGMKFIKNLKTGETQIYNFMKGKDDFIKTVVVDGKKVKIYKGNKGFYGVSSTYSPKTKLIISQTYLPDDLGFSPINQFKQYSKNNRKALTYQLDNTGKLVNCSFDDRRIDDLKQAKKLIGNSDFVRKAEKLIEKQAS